MANENQQHDVAQQPVPAPQQVVDAALGARGASRRRFARAGAGATGVLLTLTSQPGMACTVCRSPSGYQSAVSNPNATISNKPNERITCEGWPPKIWYQNMGTWKTTQFKAVFSCINTDIGNATAEKLLSQSMGYQPIPRTQSSILAMWLVAAYLNVQHGKSSFLKTETLQSIWREFELNKVYTPTAGVKPWAFADIMLYLRGTMD